jgi:NAD(P)H-dependent FMN reductase
MKTYKIALISGANRTGNKSGQLAKWLVDFARNHHKVQEVQLLDVAEFQFPVMDERFGVLETPHPGLATFSAALHAADLVLIVTPEYNGGMAGSLKNTLDYFRKEFHRKPVGAITVSSGDFGGVNALHQLWYVMLHCGAIVSPAKLLVGNINGLLNETGTITQETFTNRAKKFLDEVLWLTERIDQPS